MIRTLDAPPDLNTFHSETHFIRDQTRHVIKDVFIVRLGVR